LFGLLTTTLIFVSSELVLAMFGVTPVYYNHDPYVGFTSYSPLFVEKTFASGEKVFATAISNKRNFNVQRFSFKKSPGTYRVFCMGGSTTYGRPFDDQTSFCGWLRVYLKTFYPLRSWEVVNAGGISYASYRVVQVMQEIVQYDPDLFIVYSGHNEFLEARTYSSILKQPQWVIELDGLLNRTRVYTVLKKVLVAGNQGQQANRNNKLSDKVDTLLDHSVGLNAYQRDPEWQANVLAHYRFNIQKMAKIAKASDAELILVVPASNLKNSSPFKSEHGMSLTEQQHADWSMLLGNAQSARFDRLWTEELSYLYQAEAIDERYAEVQYKLGKVFYALGDFDSAKNSFQKALDEDICPLRALSSMPSMIYETAEQHKVPVIDFIKLLEDDSFQIFGHKILGEAYFYDHVHPKIRAHRMLAIALMQTLVGMTILEPSPLWNRQVLEQTNLKVMAKVDQLAQGRALKNLAKVLSWAGKYEDAARLSKQALQTLGSDAELYFILGLNAYSNGRSEDAIRYYQKAVKLEPKYVKARNNLGIVLVHVGQYQQAIAEYQEVLHLKPDHADAHFNLGNALMETNNPVVALKHYRMALSIQPDDQVLKAILSDTVLGKRN